MVPMYNFEYAPNAIFRLWQCGFGDPRIIATGLRSLNIPFLVGKIFRQVTMSWTSDLVINFITFLYVMEWHPNLTCYLIVWMDCSMSPMSSFVAHVCRFVGDEYYRRGSNYLSPW